MNWPLLVWQACISLGVYVTILLNGRGLVWGWLVGAGIQCLNVGYGLVTHQWGFLLSVIPGIAFVQVWLRVRKRA